VLEVGAGTGANLGRYPDGIELVVTEPDAAMLARARRKAEQLGVAVDLRQHRAYPLPFGDESFDTVVFTLCLCTIPDQAEALREAHRVLRPGGRLLFLEHVRSEDPGLATWQDRVAPAWRLVAGGCNCNRDTKRAISESGFTIDWVVEREDKSVPIPILRPGLIGMATRA